MTETSSSDAVHTDRDEKRTSYVELFFDLVFVFAITQLSGLLKHRHDAAGWAHAGLMIWMVWWAWSLYTWAGNAIDVQRRWVRLAMLVVTACTLFFAQAMPQAFASQGEQFAVAYAVVRLSGLALYWWGLRDRPDQRVALWTFLPISATAAAVILIGGFVNESARPWVWLIAVVIDFSSALAAGRGEFDIAPAHFAERHALFIIIALGESIVSVGVASSGLDPTAIRYFATGSAFVVIASMWWAYFDWVNEAAERHLANTSAAFRGRVARDLFTYLHLVFIAGTVLFAVGVEGAIAEPLQPFEPFRRWAVGVGIVMYLMGFVLSHARAVHRVLIGRSIGTVLVAGVVAAFGAHLDAVWLLVVLAGINIVMTASEGLSRHRRDRAQLAP